MHFTCREIAPAPDGFTFKPYNVYGDCTYTATRLSSTPNDRKPRRRDLSKDRMLSAGDFEPDKLPTMAMKGQQFHMPADVLEVNDDASRMKAKITFAGEDGVYDIRRTQYTVLAKPVPEKRDWKYGPHFRHTINFYRAKSDKPTPLVVSIHGGGWGALCKANLQTNVKALLDNGISVAAINYRYTSQAGADGITPPVAAPLLDATRAIQFLRHHAKELNIDKERIAATGGSAGGCSSLWLAFHDDLADPDSDDPVARESSRLWCVGGTDPQTSLDPKQMREWIPTITYGSHAFGVSRRGKTSEAAFEEFLNRRGEWIEKGWIQAFSPYSLASADDPPVYLEFPRRGLEPMPNERGWNTHSPLFGVNLKKKLDELGVECHLVYKGHRDPKYANMTQFFIDKLKAP